MIKSTKNKNRRNTKMKVDTVEQFKIMKFIEDNFKVEDIKITLKSRNEIEIQDKNDEKVIFYLENGKVLMKQ